MGPSTFGFPSYRPVCELAPSSECLYVGFTDNQTNLHLPVCDSFSIIVAWLLPIVPQTTQYNDSDNMVGFPDTMVGFPNVCI